MIFNLPDLIDSELSHLCAQVFDRDGVLVCIMETRHCTQNAYVLEIAKFGSILYVSNPHNACNKNELHN